MSEFINISDKVSKKSEEFLKLLGFYIKIGRLKVNKKRLTMDIQRKYKELGKEIYENKINSEDKIELNLSEPVIKNIITCIKNKEVLIDKVTDEIESTKDSISDLHDSSNDIDGVI